MNTKSLLYCCRMFATACLMVLAFTGCRLDGVPVEINPDLEPPQDAPCPQRPSEVRCSAWEELVTDERCNISTCEAIACDGDDVCPETTVCIDGACAPQPDDCACIEVYAPVCGTDGRTYDNACFARCAGIRVVDDGECANICPERFPGELIYVSEDPNECERLDFICPPNQGGFVNDCGCGCRVLEPPCVCPEIYAPVCGADGQTYDNACFAECAGVRVTDDGECGGVCPERFPGELNYVSDNPDECAVIAFTCPEGHEYFTNDCGCGCRQPQEICICPRIYAPVCGENGQTYGNACEAGCADVDIAHRGECEPEPCACPRIYAPVCGANGETYGNACEARCADVRVARRGQCEPESCVCDAAYDPVCGADGETYSNACHAECAGVGIASDGECRNNCICPDIYLPVCGTDGRTYGNDCEAACNRVEIEHAGECGQCVPFEGPVQNQEQCEAAGGRLLNPGIRAEVICALPTCDAGRECVDSSECESWCQAPEGTQPGDRTVGTCYHSTRTTCMQAVRRGVAEPMWCE